MAYVRNMHDTSDLKPIGLYNSWQELWESKKKRKFSRCSCVGCTKPAEVGAHVRDVYRNGVKYITPLCRTCNHFTNTDTFEVNDSDLLPI